jgi:K(+)-stimulated pyrophosphate-energized sodium pump
MDLTFVFAVGILTVAFAGYLAWDVLRRDTGTPRMQEISGMIFEGAMAFLRRQYTTIWMIAAVVAVLLGVLIGQVEHSTDLGIKTAVAFVIGAAASSLAGFIGMYVAVRSNVRTASAAQRSLPEALQVSFRGGAVSGFLIVALSLLGVAGVFAAYGGTVDVGKAPFLIVGFGFGASFIALFAQLGGGIYTKAADVGADLVGKVEAGIPEDDPRNAAVIADLVGDNVGDCAGRGADLFESTAAENIGAMILGVAIFAITNNPAWVLFPLVIRAFGVIACALGVMAVRGREGEDPMAALNRGYWVATVVSVIFLYIATSTMFQNAASIWLFFAGLVGLATAIAFVYITQYYTAGAWRPVQKIAQASKTGPATNIIAGISVGFETTAVTAIAIGAALLLSAFFGSQFAATSGLNIPAHTGAIFGTAIATMGMLMTAAFVLAMDTFGPITDNAGGIAEMSQAPENVRHITDAMDAVGNTTKALTKGYAIGSASLAAFLLFSAYLDKVAETIAVRANPTLTGTDLVKKTSEVMANAISAGQFPAAVNLAKVEVFVAGLLGVMLVFLFSSLAISAVGKAAGSIIEEVRRQIRANPGILEGTVRPDYARCVDITAAAGLREMVLPGVLAVAMPVLVGLFLKAEATAGLLMIGTIGGVLLATVLNNGGGAWDNAKKYIEAGFLKADDGTVLGKRTPAHAAAVVGDTVGDPFKDTAGPSLHVLVKLLSTITLVLAPVFL